jgi:glutathione-regulated potassium-efflux system ancillary protein KefC
MGMGRVGSGAYDRMHEICGNTVFGIDSNADTVENHLAAGRNVVLGDPTDADFWDRVKREHGVDLIMLTLPKIQSNLAVLRQLRRFGFRGDVAVLAQFPDEESILKEAGASAVFNIYAEAGLGFADHVADLRSG